MGRGIGYVREAKPLFDSHYSIFSIEGEVEVWVLKR
jgi:hypothetical protein